MSRIKINVGRVENLRSISMSAKTKVSDTRKSLNAVRSQIDSKILNRNNIQLNFANASSRLSQIENRIQNIGDAVNQGANSYVEADRRVMSYKMELTKAITTGLACYEKKEKKKKKKSSSLWPWSKFWKLVKGGGTAGAFIAAGGILVTEGVSVKTVLSSASSFAKGLETVGKKATAPSTNVISNIQKSVSKYNFGNAKSVSGKMSVAAKWAGTALTVASSFYENFTDKKEHNSTQRKIAESVGEAAVTIAEGIVVGAVIGAVGATIGAPTLVIGVGTAAVMVAADTICEKSTKGKKDVAELVSDGILDNAEQKINEIKCGAIAVKESTSVWWKRAFA